MTALEIILLIVGFVCVCISFFVSRKKETNTTDDETDSQIVEVWTDKDEKTVRENIDNILKDSQADIVDETIEQMNKICNEKIMAFEEFSGPVLNQIDTNHQEVVFMYSMLENKKEDILDFVNSQIEMEKPQPEVIEKIVEIEVPVEVPVEQNDEVEKSELDNVDSDNTPEEEDKPSVPGSDLLKIQKMYKEGMSVLDISKKLDIGQGEVQLVIALYGGKR